MTAGSPASPLQAAHSAATRDRILEAVTELMLDGHPAALSMPRVAERAGVSLRTVYRYFPTKVDLLDAAGQLGDARTDFMIVDATYERIDDFLHELWPELLRNRALVEAQHRTPAGREVRAHRLRRRQESISRVLESQGLDAGPQLVGVMAALTSSSALFEMVDHLGLTPHQAADAAVWAIRALVDHATATGGPDDC